MDYAIKVEELSKCYRVGVRDNLSDTFTGEIFNFIKSPYRNYLKLRKLTDFSDNGSDSEDILWALRDISFDVKKGEILGIIGKNGAGKSTLLKILSRITEPTGGRAVIKGNVSSLLEVGTGFHPELTGRENIYLNGTILGMSKSEIDRKLDEIVSFSEIEKFIDTPIKRYSSGMAVRLAFSVAAHLEPEILIVDEVLAVGDMEFQKKCLGKIEDVVEKQKRTVLFVSHNISSVLRICKRAILLDKGLMVADDEVNKVANMYLRHKGSSTAERVWEDSVTAPGDETVKLRAVRIISDGEVKNTIDIRKDINIEIEYLNYKENSTVLTHFSLTNDQGLLLFISADYYDERWGGKPRPRGVFKATSTIPGNILSEGRLYISVEIWSLNPSATRHVHEVELLGIDVIDKNEPGSVSYKWGRNLPGIIRPALIWKTQLLETY